MVKRTIKILFVFQMLFLLCCTKENNTFQNLTTIPEGFPKMDIPEDNQFTNDRWLLGKKMFYDPALSRDSSISCASCHIAGNAFSDDVQFSLGVENALGSRNSPTLTNVGYQPYFMREGGVSTLEQQVLVPLQEHTEMDFNIVAAGERLQQSEDYIALSLKAYGRMPDYYVITRALACFERTLVSGNSDFDKYNYQNIESALNESEKQGMILFNSSQTNCSTCHSDFNFTNYAFENNGLYEDYMDEGRFVLTGSLEDIEKFKVPTLRNVGVTAPYMHDGSINSLEEVIEHYDSGGANNPNKSELIQPLNLTEIEKASLLAFLHSLTDYEFINNELLKP